MSSLALKTIAVVAVMLFAHHSTVNGVPLSRSDSEMVHHGPRKMNYDLRSVYKAVGPSGVDAAASRHLSNAVGHTRDLMAEILKITDEGIPQKYCGGALTEMMSTLCEGRYNDPLPAPRARYDRDLTSGLAYDCCTIGCTPLYAYMYYCQHD